MRTSTPDTVNCQIWWATTAMARWWHPGLLSHAERERRGRLRHAADRDRFTVGVALTRLVLAGRLGVDPRALRLERRCPGCGGDHGKPRLSGPYEVGFSVSHTDEVVVLALARDSMVGVDVERLGRVRDLRALGQALLSPDERGGPLTETALLRRWVRKEAAVKATGDGLKVPLADLTVSAPGTPARLLGWPTRPELRSRMTLRDLHPAAGYLASLAIATAASGPITVWERDAGPVLATEPGTSTEREFDHDDDRTGRAGERPGGGSARPPGAAGRAA
ncbi:4'-phosphopantetheinyl transferase superfamily protein [Microbispora sp. NPDC046933]|uniref:4'-phosphopantetheinyl transferase family protein n=1 Tax=Microbispora sp. NPDC046933 TaxID=3155618 RepID=UPI0033FBF5A1